MSKLNLDISEYQLEEITRLKMNYYKIGKVINAIKDDNANGSWLLSLQKKGIHPDITEIIETLVIHRRNILKELDLIGGNLFTSKVLE